jgi:hypothetical protein
MKRILFAGGGNNFPQGGFEFLKSMHGADQISVKGLFFSPIGYQHRTSVSHISTDAPYLRLKEKEPVSIDASKALFAEQCELSHIKYDIHGNKEQWNKDIFVGQSRFADLVVLSRELFYADTRIDDPATYLHKALRLSECPVMLVPEVFSPFERLVVAYDGSKESLFALKQLCYLFPQYTDLPTEIVYVNQEGTDEIPDIEMLSDYCRLHFENMNFQKLHFKPGQFASWVTRKKNALLVSGSFGRSSFSYANRRSFVEAIAHDQHMPVFIAHSI